MSATTSELLDSYTKMLDSEFYKNLKGITEGIEALQKSLVGSDLHKQMQAWQTVLTIQKVLLINPCICGLNFQEILIMEN